MAACVACVQAQPWNDLAQAYSTPDYGFGAVKRQPFKLGFLSEPDGYQPAPVSLKYGVLVCSFSLLPLAMLTYAIFNIDLLARAQCSIQACHKWT